jgi:signal transduction histidine kinase
VALGVAGLGLLLLGVYGLRTRAVRRRNVELEAMNERLNLYVEERQRLIAELESRNAELERFTYTVSHDLKSPLVTIRGFLGHLKRDAEAGDLANLSLDVEHIDRAAHKMARLLDELLELSRIGRVVHPPQDVDMAELAREAVRLLDGPIRQRGVEVEIVPELGTVRGDRLRLSEVVQNLIENAVRYMGEQPAPRVTVGVRGDGEPVFFVSDNGCGIPRRYHERIFGLFERLDSTTAGTGVGLALVKRIVEVHGGRIWVESEGEGRGSTFCFTLPALISSPHPEEVEGMER